MLLPLNVLVSWRNGIEMEETCGKKICMNILTFYPRWIRLFVLLRDYTNTENIRGDDLVIDSIIAARGISRYKAETVIVEDHTLFFSDCFFVLVLSARSLKITKVDCRQKSGLNNWISNTYLPLHSAAMKLATKGKGGGTNRAVAYLGGPAKSRLRNYSLQLQRKRASTSFLTDEITFKRKIAVRRTLHRDRYRCGKRRKP